MKIGVLVNLSAGQADCRRVLALLKERWVGHRLLGVREYGGEMIAAAPLPAPDPGLAYIPRLKEALGLLISEKPDMILSVGGDGTASYLAEEMIRRACAIPLAGMGIGTANVGPIVSFSPGDMPLPQDLIHRRIGALEVQDGNGDHLAYGFNDVVLANTYLGTREGRTVTLDARALAAEGKVMLKEPALKLFREEQAFFLNGSLLPALPFMPAQLTSAPLEHDDYMGKSATGLLCWTPYEDYCAALYTGPEPLLTMENQDEGISHFRLGAQMLLKPGNTFEARDLAEDICAVADGNPFLLKERRAKLLYRPQLISVLVRR